MKNLLIRILFAWALFALSALSVSTASAATASTSASHFVWTIDSHDLQRTQVLAGTAAITTYYCKNIGDADGKLTGIGVYAEGVGDCQIQIGSQDITESTYYSDSNARWATLDSNVTVAPGATIPVIIRGIALTASSKVRLSLGGISGWFGDNTFPDQSPAYKPVVDDEQIEGLGANLSVRTMVSPDSPTIIGFVVSGNPNQAYPVLVRAVGPTLKLFGVADALSDPSLQVSDSKGAAVMNGANDDWGGGIEWAFQATGAFDLSAGSKDAATVVWLTPGAYRAQVKGYGSSPGEVLFEMYQLPLNIGKG